MAEIPLCGKYAIGAHAVALVDDRDFERLSLHAWKAKRNAQGTHVYAVRNTVIDGRNTTIRMHREVLGYTGPLDVRFWNGNRLDNRRQNLLIAPRSSKVQNPEAPGRRGQASRPKPTPTLTRPKPKPAARLRLTRPCDVCHAPFDQLRRDHVHCSARCRFLATHPTLTPCPCAMCGTPFQPHQRRQITCSQACRRALARKVRKSVGSPSDPPRTGSERLESALVEIGSDRFKFIGFVGFRGADENL